MAFLDATLAFLDATSALLDANTARKSDVPWPTDQAVTQQAIQLREAERLAGPVHMGADFAQGSQSLSWQPQLDHSIPGWMPAYPLTPAQTGALCASPSILAHHYDPYAEEDLLDACWDPYDPLCP